MLVAHCLATKNFEHARWIADCFQYKKITLLNLTNLTMDYKLIIEYLICQIQNCWVFPPPNTYSSQLVGCNTVSSLE